MTRPGPASAALDFAQRARSLPASTIGRPGPERDDLTRRILTGVKTATTSLLADYAAEQEPLPTVGALYRLVDSADAAIAIIEVTRVRLRSFDDVDAHHAHAEGEGLDTVAAWRDAHLSVWPEATAATELVLEEFRVVARAPR
ncbi:ASCH domain-containing protein [Leifsonia sp. F6_8S_P_1B]|uniref:ASCH domain-containing protein n=1 Tax=Leifsonia williamsii TaxID=3035919 RepID=A0ABT8K6M9_9MICO|nr:ASCH domain-containing protein [Leifsonia williamsii]MDN4612837.1 ASCH domain-containing protein [Leifsonia williamsii]